MRLSRRCNELTRHTPPHLLVIRNPQGCAGRRCPTDLIRNTITYCHRLSTRNQGGWHAARTKRSTTGACGRSLRGSSGTSTARLFNDVFDTPGVIVIADGLHWTEKTYNTQSAWKPDDWAHAQASSR